MQRHESRILFLKEFTKELILQSKTPGIELREERFELMTPLPEQKKFLTIPTPQTRYRLKPISFITPQTRNLEFQQNIKIQKPEIRPQPTQKILEFKKLDFLIRDSRVTVIECPGPEKFILARTAGQTTLTNISLNSQEIQEIIETFAREAKIPVISGLFKAAVGDLIITAVISELVGSRFIITKITPRFMMEQSITKH